MKRFYIIILGVFLSFTLQAARVGEWKTHLAYNQVILLAEQEDLVYALAEGAIFSVNKHTGATLSYDKISGLKGSTIANISYNPTSRLLLISYKDGLIDLMDKDGGVYTIVDVKDKDISSEKGINHVFMHQERAYCSMPFGIMVVNMRKREIADSYYIGEKGKMVNVLATAILNDTIYAITSNTLYRACLQDNLQDYTQWQQTSLPSVGELIDVATDGTTLYLLQKGTIFALNPSGWKNLDNEHSYRRMSFHHHLFGIRDGGVGRVNKDTIMSTPITMDVYDVIMDGTGYWLAAGHQGLAYQSADGSVEYHRLNGPLVNSPYRLKMFGNRLYMLAGARWASQSRVLGCVMMYDGELWHNISNDDIVSKTQMAAYDFMNVAVDPLDQDHFFVTSYGQGLFEFKGMELLKWYSYTNSPIKSAVPTTYADASYYVRTDGAMMDDSGNLWLLNIGEYANPIHVISRAQLEAAHTASIATWTSFQMINALAGGTIGIATPQEMMMDNRNSNFKWIPIARSSTGLVLLDDGGTPHNPSDDRSYYRNAWTDQDGNVVQPNNIYCCTQDKKGDIWLGTNAGIIPIPHTVDFRVSAACERIKIPRNDGTNLADYLLGTETVKAIAVDGANRKWIGTEGSGVYLMSEDGLETIEHFTEDNSPLMSNKILSIAINAQTGIVYIGTELGLISYQSDATDPAENYSDVYAYPNPVRPDYEGPITIAGLMGESAVKILDAGGNLVYETNSYGGMAIWDGRNSSGRKVASGVYSVFANSGNNHQVIKILIMR